MGTRSGDHPSGPGGPPIYNIRCEWCGVIFRSLRTEAKTCKLAHRLKWSRWCRRWKMVSGYRPVAGPRGNVSLRRMPRHGDTLPLIP